MKVVVGLSFVTVLFMFSLGLFRPLQLIVRVAGTGADLLVLGRVVDAANV